ncbi:hypothetical protein HMPREF9413_2738 [Paenibacillus sp. HGF7]|nr:hypothetical protein HMPREF9413_2738 [Paenibacillus sp. HGF7]
MAVLHFQLFMAQIMFQFLQLAGLQVWQLETQELTLTMQMEIIIGHFIFM